MILYIRMYFAFRSGQEHRHLRYQPSKIEITEPAGQTPYVIYTEDVSKTKLVKVDWTVASEVTNVNNSQRCLVRALKLYNSKCPTNWLHNALYLKTLRKSKGDVWFQATPFGHNTLTVNHSLPDKRCRNPWSLHKSLIMLHQYNSPFWSWSGCTTYHDFHWPLQCRWLL